MLTQPALSGQSPCLIGINPISWVFIPIIASPHTLCARCRVCGLLSWFLSSSTIFFYLKDNFDNLFDFHGSIVGFICLSVDRLKVLKIFENFVKRLLMDFLSQGHTWTIILGQHCSFLFKSCTHNLLNLIKVSRIKYK